MKKVPVSCNKDCGGGCPLLAHVKDGRVTKITNNPLKDPFMVGCAKGFHTPDVLYAKDRLKRPLLRIGSRGSGNFNEISWREALDRIAERLEDLRTNEGCESVLAFDGSGSCIGNCSPYRASVQAVFSLFGGSVCTGGTNCANLRRCSCLTTHFTGSSTVSLWLTRC